jgi:hypothetical protein
MTFMVDHQTPGSSLMVYIYGDEEDCTLHGSCNTANHQCTCVPGKIIACTSRYVT